MFSYLDKPFIEWTMLDVIKITALISLIVITLSIIIYIIFKIRDRKR